MALPNFSTQGVVVQTDFASTFTTSIDIGAGPNNTIVGWIVTVSNGERPNDLTIGGVSATVSSMITRSTVLAGSVGYMRSFKLVNSSLTGSQTFVCNKVDGAGAPVSVSNMKIFYAVYKDAASITAENVTATQNTLTQSTTVTSPSGELAVWSAASDATRNTGADSTLTGTGGTTVRSGPFNFNEPSIFMDKPGAGSTTLNATFANVYTPNTYGVSYSFAGATSGTAPSITVHPSNQSVTEPATATFSVTATGTGTLTYQWQRNPNGNTTFANISGANSSSYTTPATTVSGGSANNTDTYRVIVTGDTSPAATSNAATLTVSASSSAPSISTQPSNQSVSAGATATFSVVATGTSLTYQWQRNPTGATTFSNISGATSSSYTTPATTVSGGSANNTDTYRVIVSGSIAPPATSNAALLTVVTGPVNIPFTPRAPYIKG